jgi:hypothetical protein
MLYGRLVDNNCYSCETLADLSYPIVLLQGRKSGRDRFIERLRGDLYGVLNVPKILYRNCARSLDHKQKRSIFAFCSPLIALPPIYPLPLGSLGFEYHRRRNRVEVPTSATL